MNFSFLKKYDLYIKPHEDFQIKTAHGGIVTLTAIAITSTLFLMELFLYLTPEVVSDMRVDKSRKPSLTISLDITFHKAPCDAITFNAIDVSGMTQPSIDHTLMKQRIDKDGFAITDNNDGASVHHEPVILKPSQNATDLPPADDNKKVDPETEPAISDCGSCYGAESMKFPCCKTCEDVAKAYHIRGWKLIELDRIEQCVKEQPDLLNSWAVKVRESLRSGQGCRIHGNMKVNRVAGTIYVAPGHNTVDDHGTMVHKFPGMGSAAIGDFIKTVDHAHTINKLHFGDHTLPDQENPLDGVSNMEGMAGLKYTYFLKIVPSTYEKMNGNVLEAAQYSMTQHGSQAFSSTKLPGVWMDYQISPMVVRYVEKQRSFTHFLTNLCAIIGGIFAVAGVLDSTVYRSMKLWRKQQLGKD